MEVSEDLNEVPKPVINITLETKEELYASNMPFIKKGGIFIPTNHNLELGDLVILELKLMDEVEIFTLQCQVVWKTPAGAQGNMAPGVGLQFLDETGDLVRKKINAHLGGSLESDARTDTM